jgi:hypothetical protein
VPQPTQPLGLLRASFCFVLILAAVSAVYWEYSCLCPVYFGSLPIELTQLSVLWRRSCRLRTAPTHAVWAQAHNSGLRWDGNLRLWGDRSHSVPALIRYMAATGERTWPRRPPHYEKLLTVMLVQVCCSTKCPWSCSLMAIKNVYFFSVTWWRSMCLGGCCGELFLLGRHLPATANSHMTVSMCLIFVWLFPAKKKIVASSNFPWFSGLLIACNGLKHCMVPLGEDWKWNLYALLIFLCDYFNKS